MMPELEWIKGPLSPQLSNREVHLWNGFLPREEIKINEHSGYLSKHERNRAERFSDKEHALHYIWQHATLRHILGSYLTLEPSLVKFAYDQRGKPSLSKETNLDSLNFNLSHSDEILLIALTRRRAIGIDVEKINPIADMDHMVELYFSDSEGAVFAGLPESEKAAAFYAAWTRKEAFLKALGEGLNFPPQAVEVSVDPNNASPSIKLLESTQSTENYRLFSFQPAEGYIAALAVEGRDWSATAYQLHGFP